MRRPSLAFLAVLPLLQQLPQGYVPSENFGGPAPEEKCDHQWEASGHEGPYWISECKLCGAEKSRS